tara:strand:- start:140 stop:757 length:618 start_codon:yes stop_codon:yes gene_type:complete
MEAFRKLTSTAAPIQVANIDTDQIIPARFLKTPRSTDHGQFLFHDMRRGKDGNLREEFILNQKEFKSSGVLVADNNFGCGSSRESAVYALHDAGIKCVIAPSFGDIFYTNSLKNGLLPIKLDRSIVQAIWKALASANSSEVEVDLENQIIHLPNGSTYDFEIDPFRKQCLLEGLDDIDLTLKYQDSIEQHELSEETNYPWTRSID